MADLTFDDLIPSGGASAPAQGGGDLSFDDLVPNELSMRERSEQNLKPIREEAWRTTKEMAGHAWETLKGGLAPRESSPDEGFWEGYGKDLASAPGRFGKFAAGVLEAPMVPLAPAIGAAKSIIGRPMAHGIHKIGEYLNPEVAAKQTPEGIYQDIREDVGSAVQAVLPAKWKSEMPLPGRPRVPENAPPNVRDAVQKRIDALPPEEPADVSPALRGWLGPRSNLSAASDRTPLSDYDPSTVNYLKNAAVEETGRPPPYVVEEAIENASPHETLGELFPELLQRTVGLARTTGGPWMGTVKNFYRQRQSERPGRLREMFDEGFGPNENREQLQKIMQVERDKQTSPFWERFRSAPIPPTDELAVVDRRLKVNGAWKAAEKALGEEGIPSENQFVELPNTGEYVLANPHLPSETTRVPTAAFYQAAKEHLDDLIAGALSKGEEGANAVRRYTGIKNDLINAINRHPDPTVAGLWREALDSYAGPTAIMKAAKFGERILTEHVHKDELPFLTANWTPEMMRSARIGMRGRLEDVLDKPGPTDARLVRELQGGGMRAKIRWMMDDDAKADQLFRRIDHEARIQGHHQAVTGNSVTGQVQSAQKLWEPQAGALDTASLSDIPTSKMDIVNKGIGWFQSKKVAAAKERQRKIMGESAEILTTTGPERDAIARHLFDIPDNLYGGRPPSGPRPAPVRPSGEVEPPPPSQVPEGPPGYPQPEMTAVEATQVLRDFGYDQATINRMGGATRMATAQHLQASYPKGPPAKTPDFPGEVTPHESAPPAAAARPVESVPVPAEKPLSLLEWIRKQGGIFPDDPLAGDVRSMFGGKNPGGIIRKGGKRLDRLREGAVGEKYFLDKGDIEGGEATTDVNTLLDAMVREADGEKQYPLGSEVGDVRNRDMEARNQEQRRDLEFSPEARRLDRELAQHGVTRDMMPTDVRQRAVDMLRSGIERDPVEAFEKAMNEKLQGDLEAERAAEIGEGLEPSPQSRGMAARGNRAAPQGQSGTGQDVRGAGERNRAEKEPLRLKVLERGRSGRPIKTERMRMGDDVNQAILEAGREKSIKGAVEQFADKLKKERGLSHLDLSVTRDGGMHVSMIEVPKSDRKQGVGTAAMKDITEFADTQGMRITLTPGLKDDRHGTTSRGRLVDFYKRLGFVENKGRNKDFTTREGMYRDPVINRASGGRVDASSINPSPTEAQKEAGNYAKDHIHIHGLDITIENAKGSKRSGVDKGGKPWSVALPAHYGYIKGSVGADKDHVDCYIGPHIKASKVYVIDQKDAQTGKFDEHKCFIGFASAKHARNCYLKAFSDGKGADRLGAMHEADIGGFKAWLAAGDTTKPIGKIAA